MAKSVISHQAVFLLISATRSPGWMPWACRWLAMRRAWSMIWAQVKVCTAPPPSLPIGWVKTTRVGAVCSQW